MKIAVTGASGHVGNVVCRKLIEKGCKVKAFYNSDSRSLQNLDLELVQGNVLNKSDLSKLIEHCDFVINCAAMISINGDRDGLVFKTNTEGPKNILEVAIQHKVKKIIHVSSVHAVHDLPHSTIYNEQRAYKSQENFAYDYSKAKGEQEILTNSKNQNIEVVVVRPSCVLGPFDFKPSKMGAALMNFYKEKIPMIPKGGYDLVDVRDLAESIYQAISKGKNGEVYLLSGKYYSFKELLKEIHLVTNKKIPKIILPFWFLKATLPFIWILSKLTKTEPSLTYESIIAIKEGHPNMDNSKAKEILHHNPRPLKETLSDFFKWQLENTRNQQTF